jgi:glucose-6-phosphate isomerase
MAMRMREVMYVAHLMNVNAFNQPNVELYKDKTRAILKI